jgi:DNA-binding response OmpR family regulator
MEHRILVVEDDDGIAMPLKRMLEREGYAVDRVATGQEGIDRARAGDIDLVVLDLGLPDVDGLDVCRTLRAEGTRAGILILTARDGELDRVVGLDVGADDYLAKPFGVGELLARTRALLRRAARASAQPVAATPEVRPIDTTPPEPFKVEPEARRVWVGGVQVPLSTKEFDLLALLHANADTVLTRERLMDEVWDENWFGSTKTLDVTVGRLRQKLEDRAAPVRIVTVRGVGFRLEIGPAGA